MVFDYEADCSCNARMLLQPCCKEPVGPQLRPQRCSLHEEEGHTDVLQKSEARRNELGTFGRICPELSGFSEEIWIQNDAAASKAAYDARRNDCLFT